MSIFAERLRLLRTEREISMKELAKQIGTTDAAVSNWENGINEPKLSYIVSLCKFFDVSADYLTGISSEI